MPQLKKIHKFDLLAKKHDLFFYFLFLNKISLILDYYKAPYLIYSILIADEASYSLKKRLDSPT